MGPKKTVTVQEAISRNLAPFLEMRVKADGIPTALEPDDIVAFLHETEQYNAQRTDVMDRALILSCMSGDVRNYLAQYENLLLVSYTEDEQEHECELLSYDRWDPNKKAERQKCLDWDERIADALRKEFGLSRHGNESFKMRWMIRNGRSSTGRTGQSTRQARRTKLPMITRQGQVGTTVTTSDLSMSGETGAGRHRASNAIAAEELITSRGTAQGNSHHSRLDRGPCRHRRQELWRRHQHPQCRLSRRAVRWISATCRLNLVEWWSLSHEACPGSEQH